MSFQQVGSTEVRYRNSVGHFLSLSAFLEPSSIGEYLFASYHTATAPPPDWTQIHCSDGSEESSDDEETSDMSSYEDESNQRILSGEDIAVRKRTWEPSHYWRLI